MSCLRVREERAEAEIECQHLNMHTTHIWKLFSMSRPVLGCSPDKSAAREVFWGLGSHRHAALCKYLANANRHGA